MLIRVIQYITLINLYFISTDPLYIISLKKKESLNNTTLCFIDTNTRIFALNCLSLFYSKNKQYEMKLCRFRKGHAHMTFSYLITQHQVLEYQIALTYHSQSSTVSINI